MQAFSSLSGVLVIVVQDLEIGAQGALVPARAHTACAVGTPQGRPFLIFHTFVGN